MILSLTKTPFCTGIGQACSSVYQFITVSIFFKLNFKVDKRKCYKKEAGIVVNYSFF